MPIMVSGCDLVWFHKLQTLVMPGYVVLISLESMFCNGLGHKATWGAKIHIILRPRLVFNHFRVCIFSLWKMEEKNLLFHSVLLVCYPCWLGTLEIKMEFQVTLQVFQMWWFLSIRCPFSAWTNLSLTISIFFVSKKSTSSFRWRRKSGLFWKRWVNGISKAVTGHCSLVLNWKVIKE